MAVARERVARLLGGAGAGGSFSARLDAPADGFRLEVDGAGPVVLPLRAPRTRKLIDVASPAVFGRGEETLRDSGVRDTWQIPPELLTLGGPAWPRLLEGALDHFRGALGLAPGTRLRAEPHALLVYGKGQFFLPHQDSEKDDAMVATLVLSLPSAHTGGDLIVEHAGQRVAYSASKTDLTLVAFYADCRHEVTPVRSGYRVTLTFNLLTEPAAPAAPDGPVTELTDCLTEHFTTPARQRYSPRPLDPPYRLVCLLDHEYSQKGLSWDRLKGTDAERAALLRTAAGQADCETVLALAEVKETREAYRAGDTPWGRYDDYDDYMVADDAPDDGDYEIGDVVDDEITLGWWTGPDGTGGEKISLRVRDHECCAATPHDALTPHESHYEGYMGNYGNTLDRWYRRAAVVVWPRDRALMARGEAGPGWALRELTSGIARGDAEWARTAAASLAPLWKHTVLEPDLLGTALKAAEGLDAPDTAAALLEPFGSQALTPQAVDGLAAAARRYGRHWLSGVLDGWFAARRHSLGHDFAWADALPDVCAALRDQGAAATASTLVEATARAVDDRLSSWLPTTFAPPSRYARAAPSEIRRRELEHLAGPLAAVLAAVDNAGREAVRTALRGYPDTVLECLLPLLHRAVEVTPQGRARRPAHLNAIAQDCAYRLRTLLDRQPREKDDWSLDWSGCGCGLCAELEAFLRSRSTVTKEWPLAKDGRRHVHSSIDGAELPVRHATRRQGRPYTLVLTKTREVFEQENRARRQAEADLSWLASVWDGAGSGGQ
ncbi:2OG-Fe(II) oxygenase [Streptomyces sp. NPDC057582]|uniref:2OG-Fe(II) oxygenase n=1 Tax=Streptomyces sp. NPDC057582 TaxID=3346174 RepID=UPI0036D0F1CF